MPNIEFDGNLYDGYVDLKQNYTKFPVIVYYSDYLMTLCLRGDIHHYPIKHNMVSARIANNLFILNTNKEIIELFIKKI